MCLNTFAVAGVEFIQHEFNVGVVVTKNDSFLWPRNLTP